MAMDCLLLEGLEVPCRVGCTEAERAVPQSLRVDIILRCPSLRRAGEQDLLGETVDYRLALDLISAVQGQEYALIERVAEVLASVALRPPQVAEVQVTVRKRPPVQDIEMVGVQITRQKA